MPHPPIPYDILHHLICLHVTVRIQPDHKTTHSISTFWSVIANPTVDSHFGWPTCMEITCLKKRFSLLRHEPISNYHLIHCVDITRNLSLSWVATCPADIAIDSLAQRLTWFYSQIYMWFNLVWWSHMLHNNLSLPSFPVHLLCHVSKLNMLMLNKCSLIMPIDPLFLSYLPRRRYWLNKSTERCS